MSIERKYFGTDGIRGVASEHPLDPESLVRLGKATASVFLAKRAGRHRILIGKDTRLSGYMIENSLAAGLTAMGVDVLLVGPLPTAGVAYLTKSMRVDAGIMISASHNPYQDNGLKFFGPDGFKLADDLELELERLMSPGELDNVKAESAKLGKAYRIDDAVGRYTVYLKSCFSREFSLEKFRIGLDCANGAAYLVAPQTFDELGADVVSRGISPNGRNINAGFGSLYPEIVRKLVLEQNLDLGIALDGDADRAIIIDEKGTVHDGDVLLAICAASMKKRGMLTNDLLITTVMSNLGLSNYCKQQDIKLEQTVVGDRYVLEGMQKYGAVLGGEQSGHIIFLDLATSGDGILTALKILEVMQIENKTLAELAAEFRRYPQRLVNVEVGSKPELMSVPEISDAIQDCQKKLENNGRLLVRYSGTENKVRVMVECEDETKCDRFAQKIADVIQRAIGAV